MSQKFPFVFKASQTLPAAPRDMGATCNSNNPKAKMPTRLYYKVNFPIAMS